MGARTMQPANGSASWIVTNATHWIFAGTGMKNGDLIPGLVGWEHHGNPAKIPGLEVIAAGEALKASGDHSSYAATVYPGPKDNWVFNAQRSFGRWGWRSRPVWSRPTLTSVGHTASMNACNESPQIF